MIRKFSLEYWKDEDWYVGRLKEITGIFSQGKTLEELEQNIKEVFILMLQEQQQEKITNKLIHIKELEVEV